MKRGNLFVNKLAEAFRKNFYLFIGILMITFLILFIFYGFLVIASSGTPYIELKSPFNNKIDLDGNIIFAYNVTDPVANVINCSLIFDDTINQTNSSITKSVIQYFSLEGVSNGEHNWSINCTNDVGDENNSETWVIKVFIDTTNPIVTLNDPVDNLGDSDGNVIFNYTVNDDGWITNCSLYTDISGTWQINQTNIFVQKNTSLYFTVDSIANGTTFKWNVLCYDFALNPNYDWADANWTLTINNSAPEFSTIPNQEWQEDNYTLLNLSNYFSDPDGDMLNYNSTSPNNIIVDIDNGKGIVTLKSDANWYGSRSVNFYASDPLGENINSNTVTLIVNEAGDTPPNHIYIDPIDRYNDTDGFITFICNATDDYDLNKIEFYTDTNGTWKLSQTKEVSGIENSTTFLLANLTDGSYTWACKFYDNNSQSSWSRNQTFNVEIKAAIYHNIITPMVENYTYNYTTGISIGYSILLNNSLTLGNLTFYKSNGEIYFTENMSDSSKMEMNFPWWENSMVIHKQRVNITPYDIFYGNLNAGNTDWLNITIQYYYKDKEYLNSEKVVIGIIEKAKEEEPPI